MPLVARAHVNLAPQETSSVLASPATGIQVETGA
jgi:hypothetical protein